MTKNLRSRMEVTVMTIIFAEPESNIPDSGRVGVEPTRQDRLEDDWNPWGEDFEPERSNAAKANSAHTPYTRALTEDNRPAKYTVEIWGKAAIGEL